jgi:3-hydroxybutyryl-CoA dehydrogenase
MIGKPAQDENIVAVGAGRMGRGIAHVFAYAGRPVTVLDVKPRGADDFARLDREGRAEIEGNMRFLASLGVMNAHQVQAALQLITFRPLADAPQVLAAATVIIEGVPETREAKQAAFALIGTHARPDAVVASTTSSMLVTDLQGLIAHPERFLNTHFLNPAYLIPLVEVSPGPATSEAAVKKITALYEAVGKVPVRCAASPGYIVPRLQALLMAEATRMVAAGVATAEDIDKGITFGFGPRYATMGVLEFVDWGGVDILFWGGHNLAKALNSPAHAPAPMVEEMMKAGHRGMREGRGFYDFSKMDIAAYQKDKLTRFVNLLRSIGQLPRPGLPEK